MPPLRRCQPLVSAGRREFCRHRWQCAADAVAALPGTLKPPFLQESHLDARLLDILACPVCKGPLRYERKEALLICRADRLAFPIRDDIPVMLEDEARVLAPDDRLLDR